MSNKVRELSRRNPVARYATRFQKASAFRDRTKYRRHKKHRGGESYPLLTFFSS